MNNYGSIQHDAAALERKGERMIRNSSVSYLFMISLAVIGTLVAFVFWHASSVEDDMNTRMSRLGSTSVSEPILFHSYPRRPFIARSNVTIPVIGFPGASLALLSKDTDQPRADNIVRHVVEDLYMSYFDVAPEYGDGIAQSRLGPALKPYRKKVFLAAKTMYRNAVGSAEDLANTLKALETDYLDLYQFHSISTQDDVDAILGDGGAMETFQRAKQYGIIGGKILLLLQRIISCCTHYLT